MKKIIAKLVASVLAVSAIPAASVANASESNDLQVSYEKLTEEITVDDIVIAAGSYAVTISVSNSSGFSAASVKMEIPEGYAPIKNDNTIVTGIGTVLDEAIVCGVNNENTVVISTASAYGTKDNGELFTFYVEDIDSAEILSIEINSADFFVPTFTEAKTYGANSVTSGYYKIGDVTNDGYIDAVDASNVLAAIRINNNSKLPVATANKNLHYYFPDCSNIVCAQAADPLSPDLDDPTQASALANSNISSADADDILLFYSLASVDRVYDYPNQSDGFCGRVMYYPY